jgi:hypothetical protein
VAEWVASEQTRTGKRPGREGARREAGDPGRGRGESRVPQIYPLRMGRRMGGKARAGRGMKGVSSLASLAAAGGGASPGSPIQPERERVG